MSPQHDRVAILDFGSQYTQLVARRCREAGVYCEVFSYDVSESTLRAFGPKGIIFTGSPASTLVENPLRPQSFVWDFGLPILGICYGMQVMALEFGGKTTVCERGEFGHTDVVLSTEAQASPIFVNVGMPRGTTTVWMSHYDQVEQVPEGFTVLAHSSSCTYAAMAKPEANLWAVQWHPEVTQTSDGAQFFKNFLIGICGCRPSWTAEVIANELIAKTAAEIPADEKVLLGLSGGVDSSVVAMLLHRALKDRLKCVIVDHGFMRKNEAQQVQEAFAAAHADVAVEVVDARERFFAKLAGVTDPEAKRKIIGAEFVSVFEETAAKYEGVRYLAQGTIYPDVIESAHAGNAALIKTHHNVGGLPEKMNLKLVEPIRSLFKDEVRLVGEALGLPHNFVWRHPFPGPGLAVRVLGEVTPERVEKLREADAIFTHELSAADQYRKVGQALAALIPTKAVAVKGDGRAYDEMITLRCVVTEDFMSATAAPLPAELLSLVARRISNEVKGISRVLYDYTDKPPATIEYE